MITVSCLEDGIKIRGHADYAEPGKDIVCAAVSVLVQTFIQSVENLTTDKIKYSMSPGTVDIKLWCLSGETKTLMNAFFIGVEGIAAAYPENVKLNGRKHTTSEKGDDNATLKKGTVVSCLGVSTDNPGNIWLKIPSGYIPVYYKDTQRANWISNKSTS